MAQTAKDSVTVKEADKVAAEESKAIEVESETVTAV